MTNIFDYEHCQETAGSIKTFENWGALWKVVREYQLTDEQMREFNLYCRNRITIECIGIVGETIIRIGERMDYAVDKFPE